jgi:ribosomal protein L40E
MPDNEAKPITPEPRSFPEDMMDLTDDDLDYLDAPTEAPPMPHVEHAYSAAKFVCVRCGSNNLAHGNVVDYGEKFEQVHFAPRSVGMRWLNSVWNLRPWRSLIPLQAVACRDCGAVLLEISPERLRRAERRRE